MKRFIIKFLTLLMITSTVFVLSDNWQVEAHSNFGYEQIGATRVGEPLGREFGSKFTLSEHGFLVSMTAYLYAQASGRQYILGIYDHDSVGNKPNRLLAQSAVQTTLNFQAGWYTALLSRIELQPGTYWLMGKGAQTIGFNYDNASGTQQSLYKDTSSWGNFSDPFPLPTGRGDIVFSVYATYETQCYLSVVSPHGVTSGEGWYDVDTTANASLNADVVDYGGGTRFLFTNWNGDATEQTIA